MDADNIVSLIKEGIDLLPQIVLYIVPGYITLTIYYVSRDKIIKENRLLIVKSIFVSYLYLAVSEITPYVNKNISLKVIFISAIAICVGLVSNWILQIKPIKWLMKALHHTTLCSDIVDEILEIGKGVYIRAYLKDDFIVYEGYMIRYRVTDNDKHYLILDCYRKDTIKKMDQGYTKSHIHSYDNTHERCVVIDYDDIKYLEINYDKLNNTDNK